MERIVTQTIPRGRHRQPARRLGSVHQQGHGRRPPDRGGDTPPQARPGVSDAREPDTRYAMLLAHFHAARAVDPYSPTAPTLHRSRASSSSARSPRRACRRCCDAGARRRRWRPTVAKLIEQRLGRPLEPHDLWYDGFERARKHREAELDALTRKRYPTRRGLREGHPAHPAAGSGFSPERAKYLADAHRRRSGARRGPRAWAGGCGAATTRTCARASSRTAWTTRATTSRSTSWGTTSSRCSRSTTSTTRCSRACPTPRSPRRWRSSSRRATSSCSGWPSRDAATRAAARARRLLADLRDRRRRARRHRRVALDVRAPGRDAGRAARGDGADREGRLEQLLRAGARRPRGDAAGHLLRT